MSAQSTVGYRLASSSIREYPGGSSSSSIDSCRYSYSGTSFLFPGVTNFQNYRSLDYYYAEKNTVYLFDTCFHEVYYPGSTAADIKEKYAHHYDIYNLPDTFFKINGVMSLVPFFNDNGKTFIQRDSLNRTSYTASYNNFISTNLYYLFHTDSVYYDIPAKNESHYENFYDSLTSNTIASVITVIKNGAAPNTQIYLFKSFQFDPITHLPTSVYLDSSITYNNALNIPDSLVFCNSMIGEHSYSYTYKSLYIKDTLNHISHDTTFEYDGVRWQYQSLTDKYYITHPYIDSVKEIIYLPYAIIPTGFEPTGDTNIYIHDYINRSYTQHNYNHRYMLDGPHNTTIFDSIDDNKLIYYNYNYVAAYTDSTYWEYNTYGQIVSQNNFSRYSGSPYNQRLESYCYDTSAITSIGTLLKDFPLLVHPNPTSDFLFVASQSVQDDCGYMIIDNLGHTVQSNSRLNLTSGRIDIRSLMPGNYTLILKNKFETKYAKFNKY